MCDKCKTSKFSHKLYRGGIYWLLCETCCYNIAPMEGDYIVDLGFKKSAKPHSKLGESF